MNKKLIEQIGKLEGVKTVTSISEQMPNSDNMVIITFEPENPVLHDQYGVPLFSGDKFWWVQTHSTEWGHTKLAILSGSKQCMKYTAYQFDDTIVSDSDAYYDFSKDSTHIFASKELAEKWISENKPKEPVYIDPDNGDEFFEGDKVWFYNKNTFHIDNMMYDEHGVCEGIETSKVYNTKKKCVLALLDYIAKKHDISLAE